MREESRLGRWGEGARNHSRSSSGTLLKWCEKEKLYQAAQVNVLHLIPRPKGEIAPGGFLVNLEQRGTLK